MEATAPGDEDAPPNPLKAFDAFPKVHKNYIQSGTSRGGFVSLALLAIVSILFSAETLAWWRGTEEMRVSVESGIGHGMQLNVDITVAMACDGFLPPAFESPVPNESCRS
jgi:Endoplasmic Reticulum-Golgi Intermediate Compartment (ERGIC)